MSNSSQRMSGWLDPVKFEKDEVRDDTLPCTREWGPDRSRSGDALWRSLDASRRRNKCPQNTMTQRSFELSVCLS